VKASAFDYIIPPSIEKDAEMRREYEAIMERIQESYTALVDALGRKGKKGQSANEDARFILPQAVETKIVVTMDCRELLHFFRERCCARAQWEIRELAEEMLNICRQRVPVIFGNAGAKCVALGYCPEGEKFTCGRYPTRQDGAEGGNSGKKQGL
jgi:thymidylate synthase (FAD)